MGLDDLLISTGVDQLIRLVREKGRVEIGQAAKDLSMPPRTVEDWAHVLEEEGLIAIEYKLTKINLVWKTPSAEYVAKKSEKLSAKTGQAKAQIEQLLSKVQEGGKELAEMQTEIVKAESASAITPQEVEDLKGELARLSSKQSLSVKSASERLEKLRKKVAAFGAKSGLSGEGKKGGEPNLAREIELLRKFEDTLKEQLESTEDFFGAFEARTEAMRRKLEEGGGQAELEEIRGSLEKILGLKTELASAIEAVSDEQHELVEKIGELEERVAEVAGDDGSPSGTAKQLAEIDKMESDAKRQKAAVAEQLQEALLMLKKQESKFSEMTERQGKTLETLEQLKGEYIAISDELNRANDELLSRQNEIGERIAAQMAALEIAKGGSQKVSRDELQKVSFMLRELRREQSMLEDGVNVLLKEFDILKLEASPVQSSGGRPAVALQQQMPSEPPSAFVEKVKLSQEEEDEFDRKRQELRALIRKMWEDGKGGSHS